MSGLINIILVTKVQIAKVYFVYIWPVLQDTYHVLKHTKV